MATSLDDAQATIAAFGELVGIPDLVLDESGRCALDVDESRFDLEIRHDGDRRCLVLEGRLHLDGAPSTDTLAAMLERNAVSDGRGGEVLAIDPQDDEIRLARWLGSVADAQELAVSVEGIIAETLAWGDGSAVEAREAPATETPDPGDRV